MTRSEAASEALSQILLMTGGPWLDLLEVGLKVYVVGLKTPVTAALEEVVSTHLIAVGSVLELNAVMEATRLDLLSGATPSGQRQRRADFYV